MCCLDTRISFPPTKEIPCLVTCCFVTVSSSDVVSAPCSSNHLLFVFLQCFYDYNCLCACGDDVEAMHIKMARKVGGADYAADDDEEEDDDRRGKAKKGGKGVKRRDNDDAGGQWEAVEDPETGKV